MLRKIRTLSIDVSGAPSEFRIFAAGQNATSKGTFLFDEAAARAVMADYQARGVDIMIDLEHESVMGAPVRADMRDARGWARLTVKEDGSLWAVDVRWTPDGARRLSEKTQRYISPAFEHDEEGRILALINCALVAMPATHDAPALVAASQLARSSRPAILSGNSMDPELIQKALDAIEGGDAAAAIEILKGLIASAASGGAPAPAPAASDPSAESADDPEAASAAALASELQTITGQSTIAEALSAVRVLYSERDANAQRAAAEAAALDRRKRLELVSALVTLGAETPATAWDGDPAARNPVARLAGESIDGLTARVAALRAAKPAPVRPPPAGSAAPVATLSARERAVIKKRGISEEEYIARKESAVRRVFG